MAKISNIVRISPDDYPEEYRDVIQGLAFNLNQFMTEIVNAMDKNIDFNNLSQDLITITVTTDDNGQPTTDTFFNTTVSAKGLIVINASNLTNSSIYPTENPFISYSYRNQNLYKINKVTGLQANNKYRLTVMVISD